MIYIEENFILKNNKNILNKSYMCARKPSNFKKQRKKTCSFIPLKNNHLSFVAFAEYVRLRKQYLLPNTEF